MTIMEISSILKIYSLYWMFCHLPCVIGLLYNLTESITLGNRFPSSLGSLLVVWWCLAQFYSPKHLSGTQVDSTMLVRLNKAAGPRTNTVKAQGTVGCWELTSESAWNEQLLSCPSSSLPPGLQNSMGKDCGGWTWSFTPAINLPTVLAGEGH